MEYISLYELRERGILLAANREFFHPLGLALTLSDDGEKLTLAGITDYRHDPEGVVFRELDLDKLNRFLEFQKERHEQRFLALGYIVQPIASE